MSVAPGLAHAPVSRRESTLARAGVRWRFPLAVYVGSRVLYLVIALIDTVIRHESLSRELRNWDGKWYLQLTRHGYPHTLPTHLGSGPGGYNTLGFEPLYSMLMWVGGQILPRGAEPAGVAISLICGGIATVEICVLAERWWGRAASHRAILFYCLFPGTIVFSMVYSEGLSLALVAGALFCLEDRRWVSAGLLAGAATAVEPLSFGIVLAAIVVSLLHLRREGWRTRSAWRALWAPVLSVWGIVAVCIFMWSWTGTPTAVEKAQRIAWGEKSSVLALVRDGRILVREFTHWHGWSGIDLNIIAGLIGAVFFLVGLWWLWKLRHGIPVSADTSRSVTAESKLGGPVQAGAGARIGRGVSVGAIAYTLVVFVEAFTSDNTPPNPRILICAFPVLLAFAATRTGRNQRITLAITFVLCVAMSIGSFAGGGLRP